MEIHKDCTVLLIGGAGFIGSRLAEILFSEYKIRPTIATRTLSKCARLAKYPLRFEKLDVETQSRKLKELCAQHEVVIDFTLAPQDSFKNRVARSQQMAANIIESCCSGQRIIHLSSVSVYGPLDTYELNEQSEHSSKLDSYSASKKAAEELFLSSPQASRTIVLQPAIVYGPWSGWSMGSFNETSSSTIVLPREDEIGVCNAVYVDDVCQAIIRSMSVTPQDRGNKFLICGPDGRLSWKAFYEQHTLRRNGKHRTMIHKPVSKIKEHNHQQLRSKRPWSVFSNRLKSDAQYRSELMALIGANNIIKLMKSKSSAQRWDNIKNSLGVVTGDSKEPEFAELYPDVGKLQLLLTPFEVKSINAGQTLGYMPEYDFERGMTLTRQWANWFGF